MLKKNKVARIHELYEKEHASIKTICKILNISRNTVRRYLRETEFKGYETPQLAYLRNNRAEVRAIFNSCNKRCTAMLPILEERTGLKIPRIGQNPRDLFWLLKKRLISISSEGTRSPSRSRRRS